MEIENDLHLCFRKHAENFYLLFRCQSLWFARHLTTVVLIIGSKPVANAGTRKYFQLIQAL